MIDKSNWITGLKHIVVIAQNHGTVLYLGT